MTYDIGSANTSAEVTGCNLFLQRYVTSTGAAVAGTNYSTGWKRDGYKAHIDEYGTSGTFPISLTFSLGSKTPTADLPAGESWRIRVNTVVAGSYYFTDWEDVELYAQGTLGIDQPHMKKVELYPNPTNGLLHISDVSDMQRVTILNLLGQNVKTLEAANTIDVSDLNNGVYFLSTDTGLTRKFIKK